MRCWSRFSSSCATSMVCAVAGVGRTAGRSCCIVNGTSSPASCQALLPIRCHFRTTVNTSVIQYRVADFLKRYAPFDSLPDQDLLDLAGSGRVKFHESEEYVYQQRQEA